jgi:hypothetical protein
MTYEEKMEALNALNGPAYIAMRAPGDWYCSLKGIEIGDGKLLGSVCGNGTCPAFAVDNLWKALVEDLKDNQFLVYNSSSRENRKHYRWNGFMWKQQSG